MSATTRRRRTTAQPYEVLQLTQHWRIIDGRYYRDAVVRRADGALRLYLLPDGVAA